jgi:hypothetical protein
MRQSEGGKENKGPGSAENLILDVQPVARHFIKELSRLIVITEKKKTELRGPTPQANYTDRATAACRRS